MISNQTIELDTTVEATDNWSTSRDLIGFTSNGRFSEVQQLLRFGYVVKKDYVARGVKYIHVSLFLLSLLLINTVLNRV